MSHHILDISECSDFHQTIAARPPKIVHGTVIILSLLLAWAVVWSAWTPVNLVVLATGRVRPQEIPTHLYTPRDAEHVGRVIEAPLDEGDSFKKGDSLVRLDTSRIDNLIAKLQRTIENGEHEMTSLATQRDLLAMQSQAASLKAQTELKMAEESYSLAQKKRESEVRDAQAELTIAEDEYRRMEQLHRNMAISEQELVQSECKLKSAREKLIQAQLPVDQGAIHIAKQALEVITREFAVRSAELESRLVAKRGEKETIVKDLANLELQRADAVLVAPFDGVIVSGRVRVGDMLEPGKPVYELAQQQSNCFEVQVSGEDIGQLKVGLPVRIRMDAYDYQKYGTLEGKVSFISPDSKPNDTNKSIDGGHTLKNAGAGFTVRIQLQSQEVGRTTVRGPIKLGLTGTAEIITDNESLLNILLKRMRRTISFV